jgi:hypothetical protein
MTKATTAKSNSPLAHSPGTETVAQILERERDPLIHEWLALVEKQEHPMTIQLSYEDRTGHLPQLLSDVIARLHLDSSTKAPIFRGQSSRDLRRKQGYSVANGGGRVATVASLPFQHSAQAHQATGLCETAARRCNHRGRTGRTTKTANAPLRWLRTRSLLYPRYIDS